MSETDEHNRKPRELSNSPMAVGRESPMDLDLDGSWSFDQILSYTAASSFPLSFSDQPYSPLWAFSDDYADDKSAVNSTKSFPAGGLLLTDSPSVLTCNPDYECLALDRKRDLMPIGGFTMSDYPDDSCVIKERMTLALRYFKEQSEQHVLAQLWAPVKNGGHYVLTTSGQPFVLDANINGLPQYRMVSLTYMFSVDGESDGVLGLPSRVFQQKLPEWSPNVQYYSSKEFPRLNHALHFNVRGTLALPVFEPFGQSCVGVLELIMTSPKINYAPEVDKVCKALEAVNLKCSNILDHQKTQICNEGRQNALAEILEILNVVCETHKLPLAQTWVPCRHRNVLTYGGGLKKNCSSFDGSCMGQVCMSTSDIAFYVVDAHIWGFREACAEHHLQKGQGVAGRAFASQNSCFCEDITKFCKTEYPLVHYARMFGLSSCFSICLKSSYTGDDDYILEFFLPTENSDQQTLLNSMLMTMKQHFHSLRVASGKELEEEGRSVEIIKVSLDEKFDSMPEPVLVSPPNLLEEQPLVELDCINGKGNAANGVDAQNCPSISRNNKDKGKKPERKRGKAEKSISLDILQQYFAGSLKDAAKSLGVCPTTMKRICRQHGISRWPSRKINKVNRSLTKLKHVIESVQGADGSPFTLTSLGTSSLPVAVGSVSWHANGNSSGSKPFELLEEEENKFRNCEMLESNKPAETGNETLGSRILGEEGSVHKQNEYLREETSGSPTSHGSCQGNEIDEQHLKPPPPLPVPDLTTSQPIDTFGELAIEDAGSSLDLRNLCPNSERLPEYNWIHPNPPAVCADVAAPATNAIARPQLELKAVTIKAVYREDIIRFRLSLNSGIVKLNEEVGKRLKLEMGTFDIKYFDDDNEWVLIACDADLQECLDISRSSGSNIIRLLVHDIMANLGSSCESSGN